MIVRTAGMDDVPVLAELNGCLFREDAGERDPHLDQSWPARAGAGYFEELLRAKENAAFLAVDGVEVAGYLAARSRPAGDLVLVATAELESIYVRAGRRGQGTGEMLANAFLGWAAERSARRVKVTAYAANEGALRFYRGLGFAPRSVTLDRSLPDGGAR